MKLWVLSDLHVDVNRRYPRSLPMPRPAHDAVIIAGDICHGLADGVKFIAAEGLNAKPVIYVAGNHEFYGHDRHVELAAGRREAATHHNVFLLERDSIEIGDLTFLGCTLWTDYGYAGMREQARAMHLAATRLNDHRHIKAGERLWQPQDALDEHEVSRVWLGEQLHRGRSQTKVVVTHHAPSRTSVQPSYRDDLLTAAFASNLDEIVGNAALWVHGHMHAPADYKLDGCRVLANPRGYVGIREDRAFVPDLVVEVPGPS
jgi:predicted phosphodiesterase